MDGWRHARVDRSAIRVRKLSDPDDQVAYWLTKTPQERLAAVELLRQIAYGHDPQTERIRKVVTIVRRPPRQTE